MQSVVILYAILGTATTMKVYGYPEPDVSVIWRPLALFVRRFGLLLFAIPALWVWATIHLEQGPSRFSKRWSLVTGGLVLALLWGLLSPVAMEPAFVLGPIQSAF